MRTMAGYCKTVLVCYKKEKGQKRRKNNVVKRYRKEKKQKMKRNGGNKRGKET